jgi:hypothetical protein
LDKILEEKILSLVNVKGRQINPIVEGSDEQACN